LLLSSNVERVAEARLDEPPFALPPLYVAAAAVAGAGAVLSFPGTPMVARWALGVLLATFLLGTVWDLRRRRGTLAVYIRLRREEIGFSFRSDVIEVPKLVFLVMSQPTPLVWLVTALMLGAAGVTLAPYATPATMLPLALLTVGLFWMWVRNRRNPWEPLARRLRRASLRDGQQLVEPLERALDLDPEVVLLRRAADEAVLRFLMNGGGDGRRRLRLG